MPLIYLPSRTEFFLWGEGPVARPLEALAERGMSAAAELVTPGKRGLFEGRALALIDTLAQLAAVPAAEVHALPGSVASWTLASKLALDLTSRERIVPIVVRRNGAARARWAAALQASEDADRFRDIAQSLPPAAHAVPARPAGRARAVWAPDALLRAFLDEAVDSLVRRTSAAGGAPERPSAPIERRPARRKRRTRRSTGSAASDDDHTP